MSDCLGCTSLSEKQHPLMLLIDLDLAQCAKAVRARTNRWQCCSLVMALDGLQISRAR
jgi:hypothetical protein